MNLAWLKAHKWYVAGGAVGLLILVYIIKNMQSSSAGTGAGASTDLSGGSSAVTNYDAAASLSNAQVNGQVEIAQVQAGVASQQVQAQLDATKVTTAAELAASLAKTSSDTAIALGSENAQVTETGIVTRGQVESQQIVTSGQVKQAQIIGDTLDTLGAQNTAVKLAQTSVVAQQVQQIQDHSKHASQDYTAIAPILAIETGQPSAVAPTADANARSRVAGSTTAQVAIAGGTSIADSLLKGLFGGA